MTDPTPPRRRRRTRTRVLMWVGGTLAVLVVALVGTAAGYYYHFNSQIHRVTGVIDSTSPSSTPIVRHDGTTPPPPAPAQNILLVGSDTRSSGGKHIPFTGGQPCNCADTIIVAHIPTGHRKAILVSIPRDSWVDIPAFTPKGGQPIAEHMAKINSSLAEGGPKLLVETVQQLTGVHIDHYVQINFRAFVEMVDSVGGVTVCLTDNAQDHYSGIDLSAGVHQLNGVTALEYVRQRHGLPNGDLDRIKRQQVVIQQVARKVVNAGILVHPVELTNVLDGVTSNITVDAGLSVSDMISLARTFSHFDASHMEFATAPVTDEGAWRDGQSVVLLDQQGTDTMFNDMTRGYLPGDKTATPTPRTTATHSPTSRATTAPTTRPTTSPRETFSGQPVPAGVHCLP